MDRTAGFVEGGLRSQDIFKHSTIEKPLITIVTIVYNDEEFIEQTIKSILSQTYDNVEYIVIDGGSTDKTLDIIKRYDSQIDYWISAKDKGIYDAMNRGIQLAQGVMIGLINSGDYCADNALEYFAKAYDEHSDCYYTDIHIVFDSMQITTKKMSSFNYWKGMPICHQSLFISMKTYKEIGLYNLNYKLLADYDLF
jgi:glycosyltransferase involved in cell wall biosynthesis